MVATENVLGKQQGYVCIKADKALTIKDENLYHVIHLKCSIVIRSYVENPQTIVLK